MTYQQALQLCKQKRSAVDPIPAFCDQMKRYEQECRELGYLTTTDAQNEKCSTKKEGPCSESSDCAKKQNTELSTIHTETETETEIVGSKRQVEASCDRVVKRRAGPSKPSIGPCRPSSIGPSIGPSIAAKSSQKKVPIGPQRPPTKEKKVSKEPNKPV